MKVNIVRPLGLDKYFPLQAKSNNWMKNASQDKMEEARIAREREMEMLMVARSQAIEEEEIERAAEEQERRSGYLQQM